jgi:large subunit ribosomal protein L7/L12
VLLPEQEGILMSPRIWSLDVVAIGDRIASLAADQAALLKQYLADTYGIHAASMVVTPPIDEPDVLVENGVAGPAAFDVVLDGFDAARKITVIKAVRKQLVVGLKEAKVLVEAAPGSLRERVFKDDAEKLQALLEAAGAKVSLRPRLE